MAKKKIKILVVEDEPSLLELYEMKLNESGYDVVIASNGMEGYGLAELEKPDLILLDILMPEVDGYGMLQKLKESKTTKDIPAIIFSNLSQKEEIEKGLRLGAKDFIIKTSITPTQMEEKVKEFLQKYKK